MKILAVSNHAAMLEELGKELTALCPDAEIIKETDALMAGKYAFHHEVDVVFADADMKRMNGLQLIRFVRQERPRVKSFLIGSERKPSEPAPTVPEDVTGVLTYPLSAGAIRNALQRSGL